MTNETLRPKPSPLSKIISILDKQELKDAVKDLDEASKWLHNKIGMHRDELTDLQNKLPKREE